MTRCRAVPTDRRRSRFPCPSSQVQRQPIGRSTGETPSTKPSRVASRNCFLLAHLFLSSCASPTLRGAASFPSPIRLCALCALCGSLPSPFRPSSPSLRRSLFLRVSGLISRSSLRVSASLRYTSSPGSAQEPHINRCLDRLTGGRIAHQTIRPGCRARGDDLGAGGAAIERGRTIIEGDPGR